MARYVTGTNSKARADLLRQLIREAAQDPKTDGDPIAARTAAGRRFEASADWVCVWCGLDPPRGKTLLCQACNVYRRLYGRPPTQRAVDRRWAKRIDAEAEAPRLPATELPPDDSREWDLGDRDQTELD